MLLQLTELTLVWNTAALAEISGHALPPLIVVYRTPWEGVVKGLVDSLALPAAHTTQLVFVDSAAEAVGVIERDYAARTAAAAKAVAAAGAKASQ